MLFVLVHVSYEKLEEKTNMTINAIDEKNENISRFLLLIWTKFITTWISNHMPSEVSDEITYPSTNLNSYHFEIL